MSRYLVLAVGFALCACESGSGGSDTGGGDGFTGKTCAMAVMTHGATQIAVTADEDPACATLVSTDSGVSFYMLLLDPNVRFELEIEDVMRGQVGDGFAAKAGFSGPDENRFESMNCQVSISEHEFVGPANGLDGEDYRLRGTGMCPDAVDGGGQSIEVEAFEFVVVISWRN